GDRSGSAAPYHGQVELVAGLARLYRTDQLVAGVDGLAAGLGDDVTRLQAGLRGRAATGHLADHRAAVVVGTGHLYPEVRVGHLLAALQRLRHAVHQVARDRESDTYVALVLAGCGDRGVETDEVPVEVDQRAAGVARVDRGVGLDGPGDVGGLRGGLTLVAALLDGAVQRADDAGGDRALQAERAADRQYRVADPQLAAVGEGHRGQPGDTVHLEQREVGLRVGTHDLRVRRLP